MQIALKGSFPPPLEKTDRKLDFLLHGRESAPYTKYKEGGIHAFLPLEGKKEKVTFHGPFY